MQLLSESSQSLQSFMERIRNQMTELNLHKFVSIVQTKTDSNIFFLKQLKKWNSNTFSKD